MATPPVDGALVRYLSVHAAFAHPVPDGLSDDAAALMEPLSVGIWANRRAPVGVGSRVLITGAGPIGVLAALVARAAGAGWVGITDVDPARLEVAGRFDVDEVIDGRAGVPYASFGPEVMLECSGVPAVVSAGISAFKPLGRAVLVGMGPSSSASLPVQVIQNRELSVTGTFRYAHTYVVDVRVEPGHRLRDGGWLDAVVTLQTAPGVPATVTMLDDPARSVDVVGGQRSGAGQLVNKFRYGDRFPAEHRGEDQRIAAMKPVSVVVRRHRPEALT